MVGLCHEFLGMRQALLQMFEASPDEIEARVAGINHLIWILELKVRGQDGSRNCANCSLPPQDFGTARLRKRTFRRWRIITASNHDCSSCLARCLPPETGTLLSFSHFFSRTPAAEAHHTK